MDESTEEVKMMGIYNVLALEVILSIRCTALLLDKIECSKKIFVLTFKIKENTSGSPTEEYGHAICIVNVIHQ